MRLSLLLSLSLSLSLVSACGSSGGPVGPAPDGGATRDGGSRDGGAASDGGTRLDGGTVPDGGSDIDGGTNTPDGGVDAGPISTDPQCVHLAPNIEDAEVTSLPAFENTNYGSAEILTVAAFPGGPDGGLMDEARTLVKFPVTELPANPAQVLLRFWIMQQGGSCAQGDLSVHFLSDNWSESHVTWTNQPPYDATEQAGELVPGDALGYFTIDITAAYRALRQTSIPNNGLILLGNCDEPWNLVLASSNLQCSNVDTAPYKPALLINTASCPDDPPAPFPIRDIDCTPPDGGA
jgi:hypothetical protein